MKKLKTFEARENERETCGGMWNCLQEMAQTGLFEK